MLCVSALSHRLKVYPTGEEGGVPVSKPLKVEGIHYGVGKCNMLMRRSVQLSLFL
jgi:hypothetical protein